MPGALIILIFTIIIGIVLYLLDLRARKRLPADSTKEDASNTGDSQGSNALDGESKEIGSGADGADGECCGLHLVCEKDSLSPMSADIEYYDDDELDRFIGRNGTDYTPEEEEEFRDVLMTLRPEDVYGWARSITQRHLVLPPDVRDELLILVNERRSASHEKNIEKNLVE